MSNDIHGPPEKSSWGAPCYQQGKKTYRQQMRFSAPITSFLINNISPLPYALLTAKIPQKVSSSNALLLLLLKVKTIPARVATQV
ncbi:hypothetical protein I7I50_10441 [Histoplasma capsulatum G186AR]|uniref:Uncharacterized protein n=1 Tax=Ajellomyces capsulatus TaxID=5037 RepID=A0A8H7Z9R0_AJECA|nr:hypothetical protein I7I52_01680 [Histoplasma capsulatum]QSS69226.1 hypothetical protein I7I50_10441 [Histoplasma capsulatum G186AR]